MNTSSTPVHLPLKAAKEAFHRGRREAWTLIVASSDAYIEARWLDHLATEEKERNKPCASCSAQAAEIVSLRQRVVDLVDEKRQSALDLSTAREETAEAKRLLAANNVQTERLVEHSAKTTIRVESLITSLRSVLDTERVQLADLIGAPIEGQSAKHACQKTVVDKDNPVTDPTSLPDRSVIPLHDISWLTEPAVIAAATVFIKTVYRNLAPSLTRFGQSAPCPE